MAVNNASNGIVQVQQKTPVGCENQEGGEGRRMAVRGDRRIMRHDFTGRWSGECHAIGCPGCVLHVSCIEGERPAEKRGGGKGTETGKSVSTRCDGEHLIQKQMSLPKHALVYVSCIFIA